MAEKMVVLAESQPGFIGIESARKELGISVSYWTDLRSIKQWKENAEHSIAREKGKTDGYKCYKTRISKVERDYDFNME